MSRWLHIILFSLALGLYLHWFGTEGLRLTPEDWAKGYEWVVSKLPFPAHDPIEDYPRWAGGTSRRSEPSSVQ